MMGDNDGDYMAVLTILVIHSYILPDRRWRGGSEVATSRRGIVLVFHCTRSRRGRTVKDVLPYTSLHDRGTCSMYRRHVPYYVVENPRRIISYYCGMNAMYRISFEFRAQSGCPHPRRG